MPSKVRLDKKGIYVNGEYRVILCASLFYFRIPAELWRDRARRLRDAGYNCVDVYFPWNYHELVPGQWNFTGDRDAAEFLDIMHEEGLYVVARPGPYICSEWDGGAIPAWILASDMKIRENSQPFINEVRKWYSRILPIISEYQIDRGGSVILLQIENELDFFDCPDPKAYMQALAEMAFSLGITVPLFGCAGQCDAFKATGFAKGVYNTYNLYPSSADPHFDNKCRILAKMLESIDQPLLVTETNREHYFLRRELANGVKLLGAYNQVGGCNFGFTSSINNWGRGSSPLSFIASDYNFHSMIGAAGEYNGEALEGRLLKGLIDALGESLGAAQIANDSGITATCDFATSASGASTMELHGGGMLLCVPNLSTDAGAAHICGNGFEFTVIVGAYRSPLFPIGVSIRKTGVDGCILFASAEILAMEEGQLLLYADGYAEASLMLGDGRVVAVDTLSSNVAIEADGRQLLVSILNREDAARYEQGGRWETSVAPLPKEVADITSGLAAVYEPQWRITETMNEINMETRGLYRGFALYESHADDALPVLVKGVADIITAYSNGTRLDTRISGGQWQLYDGTGPWRFKVESWGHSNFDDPRLNSLRMKGKKGITAVFGVLKEQELTGCWRFKQMDEWLPLSLTYTSDPFDAMLDPNSWNSTRKPLIALYYTALVVQAGCTDLALRMAGNAAEVAVYADGVFVGVMNPNDPWVHVPLADAENREIRLALLCRKRDWSEPVGTPVLYQLKKRDVDVFGFGEEQLAELSLDLGNAVCLPARFDRSQSSIVQFDMDSFAHKCAYCRLDAYELKATAVFNGRVVGRIFGQSDNGPTISGGDSSRFYIPAPWYHPSGNRLVLFIEPIGDSPLLKSMTMEYV